MKSARAEGAHGDSRKTDRAQPVSASAPGTSDRSQTKKKSSDTVASSTNPIDAAHAEPSSEGDRSRDELHDLLGIKEYTAQRAETSALETAGLFANAKPGASPLSRADIQRGMGE